MTNLEGVLKSRDITLPPRLHISKLWFFPVVMYGFESWTIRKAELQRIDAFELWCWRRLLRILWTTGRFNQSILKEIVLNINRKDWWWSWGSNILATWCEELTHWKRPWCWEWLRAGGKWTAEDEMVGWHHQFNGQSWTCCGSWGHKELDMTEQLKWTELNWKCMSFNSCVAFTSVPPIPVSQCVTYVAKIQL